MPCLEVYKAMRRQFLVILLISLNSLWPIFWKKIKIRVGIWSGRPEIEFPFSFPSSKKFNFWSQFFYFFEPLTRRYLRCSVAKTIQSQTMRKLNPMNRPSTPPQSATREPNEKASSSFKTCTGEEYINHNIVPPCLFIGAFIGASSI